MFKLDNRKTKFIGGFFQLIYLTFLAAILLSGIAAYYSVIGLASIFMGAFWPIVFMGSCLEFAKLVTASWLYRNWKTAPVLLKSYLTVAVLLLMLITSMGIFGFLAKSHIDSTLDAGSNSVELKTLNQQEKISKDRLDYLLARAKDPSTASNKLDRQIQTTQKELSEINKKRLPLLKENNKLVADIGPIKYVGDMFFEGDDAVDKAVRLVIIIIMVVFDPLAVLLLIAGNISLLQRKEETKPKDWEQVWQPKSEAWPPYDPDFLDEEPKYELDDGPLTDEQYEKINEVAWPENEKRADVIGQNGNDGDHYGEVDETSVKVEKKNITNISEDINEYVSPARKKVETHHEDGIYSEEHVPFDHVKYDE